MGKRQKPEAVVPSAPDPKIVRRGVEVLFQIVNLCMDPTVHGRGLPTPDGGFKPYHVNPSDNPLPVMPRVGRGPRRPQRLERNALEKHVVGQSPVFLSNISSHRPKRVWHHEEHLRNLLDHLQLASKVDLPDDEIGRLVRDTMDDGPCRLSIDEVERALAVIPGSPQATALLAKHTDDDIKSKIMRLFVGVAPRTVKDKWTVLRSLMMRDIARAIVLQRTEVTRHLVVFDIDGHDDPRASHDSMQLAHAMVHDHLVPLGIRPHICPSRRGRGAYVMFWVERQSAPEQFNDLLTRLTGCLRTKYPAGEACHFDCVKAKVAQVVANPSFDDAAYYSHPGWSEESEDPLADSAMPTNGEHYDYLKSHYGRVDARGREIRWPGIRLEFERYRVVDRDLITLVGWNLVGDKDGGAARVAHLEGLLADHEHACLETQLRKRFEIPIAPPAPVEEPTEAVPTPPTGSMVAHPKPACEATTQGVDWDQLTGTDPWRASNAAARIASRTDLDDEAAAERACDLYEQHGPATDPRDRKREDRMKGLIRFYRKHADPSKAGGEELWFDLAGEAFEKVVAAVATAIPQDAINGANSHRRSKLSHRLLAVLLLFSAKKIHTEYPGYPGSKTHLPIDCLIGALRREGFGWTNAEVTAGRGLALLEKADLLRCTNGYTAKGRCRRFILGYRFPLPLTPWLTQGCEKVLIADAPIAAFAT